MFSTHVKLRWLIQIIKNNKEAGCLLQSAFTIYIYRIWQERNQRIFQINVQRLIISLFTWGVCWSFLTLKRVFCPLASFKSFLVTSLRCLLSILCYIFWFSSCVWGLERIVWKCFFFLFLLHFSFCNEIYNYQKQRRDLDAIQWVLVCRLANKKRWRKNLTD